MNVRREPTIVIEGKEIVQTLLDHSNVTVMKIMKAMEFGVSVSILKKIYKVSISLTIVKDRIYKIFHIHVLD